jgi:4-hydroxy-3-polyprenylbenzoate decarboxylase
MLWKDLRDYIAALDRMGELRVVRGASWEEDIGGITELVTERQGPALLFDDIPGYPAGYRVGSNLFTTTSRTAVALGMGSGEDLADRWAAKMRQFKPVAPEVVSTGPIMENVITGKDVNLFKFPTPKWHEDDGGRYIGTGVCVIQQDPDNGFVNVGAYRVAIHDETTCGSFIEHGKDGDIIRRKFWERGQKCPVLVSVGQEPVLTALSGGGARGIADEVSEYEVAGYVHGSPYQVVKGQLTGIPMPAHAEIVIEGFIPSPHEVMVPEGPFGEWTGYYAHGRRPETIIEVAAIYHRNDPIIFGAPPLRPVGMRYFSNFGGETPEAKARLERAGIKGVKRIFNLASPALYVVSLTQMYKGHVEDVVKVLAPGGRQYRGHNIWILVDDDIDVTNPHEVFWAIASRCSPEIGVQVIQGTAVWQLDPRIPPDGRSNPDDDHGRAPYTAHDLVINACRPYDWIDDFPPVAVNSPSFRQRIRERWPDLFN